jgi:hypothetical protein
MSVIVIEFVTLDGRVSDPDGSGGDLIDEYPLLTFPTVLGAGERLFPASPAPFDLEARSAEATGAAILARYRRPTR